jgi:hypothetical protein
MRTRPLKEGPPSAPEPSHGQGGTLEAAPADAARRMLVRQFRLRVTAGPDLGTRLDDLDALHDTVI